MLRNEVVQFAEVRTSAGDPPGMVLASIERTKSHLSCNGILSAKNREAPTQDTLFEIGSITKVFVAVVLAKLVQDDVLSLTDPAQEFLPGIRVPTRGSRPIRLIDLATHTAALPSMPDAFDVTKPWDSFRDISVDDLLEQIERTSLTWEVGTSYLYSNLGYALLGHILETLSGKRWDLLVKETVLDPLGMTSTGVSLGADALAPSHHGTQPVPPVEFGALAPAGALRSTARDLLAFAKANLESGDTEVSSLLEVARRSYFSSSELSQMALGWHVQTRNEKRLLWHRGETLGQTSFIGIVPDQATAVIMLSNSAFGNCCCDLAVWQIDEAVEPKEHQKRLLIELSPAELARFEGVYSFAPQVAMRLTAGENHLSIEVDGARGGKMYPLSATEFMTKDERVRIAFVEQNAQIVGFNLMQHGIEQMVLKRTDA